jgi:hypothetical protein
MGALRIWRVKGPGAERFAAPEVMENVEAGEFAWMARETSEGVSWMIDDEPLTLLELLNLVDSPVSDWVVDQTLTVLWPHLSHLAMLGVDDDGMPDRGDAEKAFSHLQAELEAEDLTVLMEEFTRFGQAASVMMERLSELADGALMDGEGKAGARGGDVLGVVPPVVA